MLVGNSLQMCVDVGFEISSTLVRINSCLFGYIFLKELKLVFPPDWKDITSRAKKHVAIKEPTIEVIEAYRVLKSGVGIIDQIHVP